MRNNNNRTRAKRVGGKDERPQNWIWASDQLVHRTVHNYSPGHRRVRRCSVASSVRIVASVNTSRIDTETSGSGPACCGHTIVAAEKRRGSTISAIHSAAGADCFVI
ncbi:hypothetical protein MRX96_030556 [Rhipicephalus microplus]